MFLFGLVYGSLYLYRYQIISITLILLIATYVLNIIAGFMLFASNRESYSKLSWFILIIIFPIVGAFFFFIFGIRFRGRMSDAKYQELYSSTYSKQKNDSLINMNTTIKRSMNEISIASKRAILSCDIEIIDNGGEAYRQIFNDMRNAKKFIHAHYYIFKEGDIFEEFKSILISKVKEGVEVRLIIDDFGHWALPWYELANLKKIGIEVAVWAKVHFPFISGENGYRTHRKLMIIDGEKVFVGGVNISDEYANLSKKYGYWYDMQTKIQGHGARSYCLLFINDWYFMGNKKISIAKYAPYAGDQDGSHLIMIESGPDNLMSKSLDAITKLIMSARSSIYLTTPYFIPNKGLINALRAAASIGVDIKIIIPDLIDKKNVMLITHYYARQLQGYGVKFYTINDAFMHTKLGIFDGKIAYTGTLNLDIRSFYQQFEVINIVSGKAVITLNKLFETYIEYSTPKIFKVIQNQKLHNRAYTVLVRIFAPLM